MNRRELPLNRLRNLLFSALQHTIYIYIFDYLSVSPWWNYSLLSSVHPSAIRRTFLFAWLETETWWWGAIKSKCVVLLHSELNCIKIGKLLECTCTKWVIIRIMSILSWGHTQHSKSELSTALSWPDVGCYLQVLGAIMSFRQMESEIHLKLNAWFFQGSYL